MHEALSWRAIDGYPSLLESEKITRGGWALRAVAVRTRSGFMVVSPLRGQGEATRRALAERGGELESILAPNHFHNLGIPELLSANPSPRLLASKGAKPRLERKLGAKVEPIEPSSTPFLPDGIRLLEPPGLRNGELFLSVDGEGGRAWIVSDAFFTLERAPSGAYGLLLRATGTAPGLRIGSTFTTLAVRDGRGYRRWLEEQLSADRPVALVPSHGQILRGADLHQRLLDVVRRRLPS